MAIRTQGNNGDGWSLRDVEDGGSILFDTVRMDMLHYTFVSSMRMYDSKSDSNGSMYFS